MNPFAPVTTFEYTIEAAVDGFTTTIFDAVNGTHTTFPFGANTPPKNPLPTIVFENVRAVGL